VDLIIFQKNEITEYHIYKSLAGFEKVKKNKQVLMKLANDEKGHYYFWQKITKKKTLPNWIKVLLYILIARVLGLTFGIKLMEKGEEKAQVKYKSILKKIPNARKILHDEDVHEQKLIGLIEEERLNYVGSIVLGLNDALVELTGALAGLSFGFQNTRIIAFAGLITGVAAGFSMAAAEYLSQSHEHAEFPIKSAFYTGIAYFITVGILILPYLIFSNYILCLLLTLLLAILIILFFNYYVSVAKDLPFKKRFLEMAVISIGVSAVTFGISIFVKKIFGIEM